MKLSNWILFTVGIVWSGLMCIPQANAFIGEYNSSTGNDMAGMLTIKSSSMDYEDSYNSDLEVERKLLVFGFSKSLLSKIKLFGSFNWGIDGEIDDLGFDLDHGYSFTGAGSYIFIDQGKYSVSGFGQFDYIFKEEYENDGIDLSMDGYEMLIGAMGKYNFNPKLSAFANLEILLLSDLTVELDSSNFSQDIDVEREGSFGIRFGGIYNEPQWFLKGEFAIGMDIGFAFTGGMKF